MRLDCHIHHSLGFGSQPELTQSLSKAGLTGGIVFSDSPNSLAFKKRDRPYTAVERMDDVLRVTAGNDCLYPFFFIDPTESDARDQVRLACDKGLAGFKVICNHFYPGDERALPVYQLIADLNKPLLFHSGILYDGKNASGNFNRPCAFEPLLSIPRLKFAMAHVSWPWTDECIAVYGKFENYLRNASPDNAPELFLDITPGTPPVYRRDMLNRLLNVGYDGLADHILWGCDCSTDYRVDYSREVQARDDGIYRDMGLKQDWLDKVYWKNTLRFLGKQ